MWAPDLADQASEGWDGDRYVVVERPSGDRVGFIATIWDTPADARQFEQAYATSWKARFPKDDRTHAIRRAGTKVFVLDGDDDKALLSKLIADTKFD
jgi:hypothetical protein